MRTLSPRDIRITSPRPQSPRMAAKIAAAKTQADSLSKAITLGPTLIPNAHNGNGSRSPLLPSPLASGFTARARGSPIDTATNIQSSILLLEAKRPNGSGSKASNISTSTSNQTTQSTRNTQTTQTTQSTDSSLSTGSTPAPRPTGLQNGWPTAPYGSSPESPLINEYFQSKLSLPTDIVPNPRSAETLSRARSTASASPGQSTPTAVPAAPPPVGVGNAPPPAGVGNAGAGASADARNSNGRPSRPRRPVSPGLIGIADHQRTVSFTLPAEYVEHLRQSSSPQSAHGTETGHTNGTSPVTYIARERIAPFSNIGGAVGVGSIGESPRSEVPTPASASVRSRNTSGISFKGLKNQLASRSMSLRRGDKSSMSPPLPLSPPVNNLTGGTGGSVSPRRLDVNTHREAVGLFNPGSSLDHTSTRFASLQSQAPGRPRAPNQTSRHPEDLVAVPGLPKRGSLNDRLSPKDFLANLSPAMNDFTLSEVPSPPTHTFSPYSQRINGFGTLTESNAANAGDGSYAGGPGGPAGARAVAFKFLGINGGFTLGKKASLPSLRSQSQPTGHVPDNNSATATSTHMTNQSISGPIGPVSKSHSRAHSGAASKVKRNGSIDAASIGSPITSTFRQIDGNSSPRIAGLTNGSSPRSPTFNALMHSQGQGQAPSAPQSADLTRINGGEGQSHVPSQGVPLSLPSPPMTGISIVSAPSGASTEPPYRSPPRSNVNANDTAAAVTVGSAPSPDRTGNGNAHSSEGEAVEVKRKPVPGFSNVHDVRDMKMSQKGRDGVGMAPSESFSSSRSFVLEDPPRRRR